MSDSKELAPYEELISTVERNTSQQKLHYGASFKEMQNKTANVSKGEGDNSGTPFTFSPFQKDTRSMMFYYPFEKEISGAQDSGKKTIDDYKIKHGEISVTYDLNDTSHGLSGFSLAQMLPQVEALPGYKVRWCHNVASHIVRYGAFTHGKTRLHYFDDTTSDLYLNQMGPNVDYEGISRDLGNTPELQIFSDFLPQTETVFFPPLFFNSDDPSTIFPLHMCSRMDDIKLTLSLVKDPQTLLIIAKIGPDGEEIEIIEPQPKTRYARFIENGSPTDVFSVATGCGNYTYKSPEECEGDWCSGDDKSRNAMPFYVNQMVPFTSKNGARDSTVNIPDLKTNYPVTQINWVAQLVGNKSRHVLSNYTSNPSPDFMTSLSPIASSTINNGTVNLAKDLPGTIATRQNSRFYNRRSPVLPGINTRCFGVRLDDNMIKPGYYFNKGFVEVALAERDYSVTNRRRDVYEEHFIIDVRANMRMEFCFTTYPKSDEERITLEKSIISPINSGS